jgi:superfamily II DNA or RNA helicase
MERSRRIDSGPAVAVYAPGCRVVIRDEEWVVRRVDHASDGGYLLTCDGVSELVRDRVGRFLTQLEEDVQVLDPAQTELVQDPSQRYRASILYIESLLRQVAPNDERLHIAHKAAMDLVPYQVTPAVQSLKQPRQRMLIADAVGLGKTLEAGILVSELIHRGRGKRILVLTLKSMLTQFQKEFWNRFSIPLTRLDSLGLQRVRSRIPTSHNPFYYYDKAIISIDTLKQDTEYRVYLEQAYWDIIVIDEAHNVAERGTNSQRARLARLLSSRSDTLIMLSATPHDGRARSFASLMNMLDPTAISDPEHYTKEDFSDKGLVVRRFKKDIQSQVNTEFRQRRVYRDRHAASAEEEAAYEVLLSIPFTRKGAYAADKPAALLRVGLEKALFSSPAACGVSIANRRRELERQLTTGPNQAIEAELAALADLDAAVARITPEVYAKYRALLALLRSDAFGWTPRDDADRLAIFSERIETLHFLESQLAADLRLGAHQVRILHGGMSDVEQQAAVEEFGRSGAPLRLLLCSDVASEGINLHYRCHRLLHFDIPWSLMLFQQRNGRIDRYGQEQPPLIYYLVTESRNETIRGDMRVLEVLEAKDEQAYANIGDPSAFMHVYDVQAEEQITEEAIAAGKSAADFDAEWVPQQDEGEELLALFLGTAGAAMDTGLSPEEPPLASRLSLFESEYHFAREALAQLNDPERQVEFTVADDARRVSLVAPYDLRHRCDQLPREVLPEHWQFVLTDDEEAVRREIARSREDENAWPKLHYLWPLHPVMTWLTDRLLISFGRQRAPVIELPEGLALGEVVFVVSGLIPNRKSHPLIHEWLSARFQNGRCVDVEPFLQTLERTGLGRRPIPNRQQALDTTALRALLPEAIHQVRARILAQRDAFDAALQDKLRAQLEELARLRRLQHDQLELALERSAQIETIKAARRRQRVAEIDALFERYQNWVRDTLTTGREPYLQVVSALVRTQAH